MHIIRLHTKFLTLMTSHKKTLHLVLLLTNGELAVKKNSPIAVRPLRVGELAVKENSPIAVKPSRVGELAVKKTLQYTWNWRVKLENLFFTIKLEQLHDHIKAAYCL